MYYRLCINTTGTVYYHCLRSELTNFSQILVVPIHRVTKIRKHHFVVTGFVDMVSETPGAGSSHFYHLQTIANDVRKAEKTKFYTGYAIQSNY